jgi:3'-phosphoadenosine 5'-phosphosulfate sulfotransferase (PAPS reductase)/FAD synthetase
MKDIKLISSILKCEDKPLLEKVANAIAVFDSLDLSQKYHLAFSGGKDSHALLIVFLVWQKIRQVNVNNFEMFFADTLLETQELYSLVKAIANTLEIVPTKFLVPQFSYWFYQFATGYPVPDWKNRWCTYYLKIKPQDRKSKGGAAITGRHYGESSARDARLNNCSSGECGTDKIKVSVDPIIDFRNCDVWDLIFYADNTVLYDGVFNALKKTYSQASDEKGSLRMGCFMCPVVSVNTLKSDSIRASTIEIRNTIEELRQCKRINSARTKKAGAIYIGDRRMMWKKLNKELLLSLGYITQSEIELISECLESDYSYPKTYTREWIDSEHERLAKKTIYTGLPLFEYTK